MKILNQNPPNIDLILAAGLKPSKDTVFCYGDTIYNPSGKKLSPDIEHHESIHARQQKDIGIDEWWRRYLSDKDFRLSQEIEAYGEQYKFAQKYVKDTKLLRWALENMAYALSGEEYGNLISYGEAESKIRNYGKSRKTK